MSCRLAAALSVLVLWGCMKPNIAAIRQSDLAGAEEAFRGNIAAIHQRNVDAYLSHYLDSPELMVVSGDTVQRGFTAFAEARRSVNAWPDTLIAGEPRLEWLAPGAVYGVYQYTVVERGDTSRGWSERVLVKTAGGWRVVVTSRIDRSKR
jgi:hypothetical protein